MHFSELITARYSVRNFTNQHLDNAVVEQILKAGHLAPTGCNYQPYRVLVLNTDPAIEALKKCTKCHFNAPTAFLVCYHRGECWTRKYDGHPAGIIDASIVTTFMMLKATELGVGSTWVMHFDPAAMRREFQIPDTLEPVALLVMGYPGPDAKPLHLHNEFRPLEELVTYDSF